MHRSQPWAVTACEEIEISPYNFYPDKPVHVQVSVNHVNYIDAAYVHEAVVAWVENIREQFHSVRDACWEKPKEVQLRRDC